MRKLTAAISAAAIAATLIVPITAGAATEKFGAAAKEIFNCNFDAAPANGTFSPIAATGDTLPSDKNATVNACVAGGTLNLPTTYSGCNVVALAKYLNYSNDLTVSFNITTGATVDQFKLTMGYYMDDKTQKYLQIYKASETSNAVYFNDTQSGGAKYICKPNNEYFYLSPNTQYYVELKVDDKNYSVKIKDKTSTGEILGVLSSNLTGNAYLFTSQFKLENMTTGGSGIKYDNLVISGNEENITAMGITDNKLDGDVDNTIELNSSLLFQSEPIVNLKQGETTIETTVQNTVLSANNKTFYQNPKVSFTELPKGEYTLVLTGSDTYNRNINTAWTFTVDAAETAASAETVAADAANIESSNIQIEHGKVIKDGAVMQFYKTTVTAGTKKVNGGEITAKVNDRSVTNQFGIVVEPGQTGVFYNLVGVDGSQASDYNITPEWSYTFNEE